MLGLLSSVSKETQPTGKVHWLTQSAISVVFPNPAGAETSMTFLSRPRFSFSISRERSNRLALIRGKNSFVLSRGSCCSFGDRLVLLSFVDELVPVMATTFLIGKLLVKQGIR